MTRAPELPETVDVIVLGSGAGALCTAIAAHRMGLEVLILEKDRWFGGATARSGAAHWLPCSQQARDAGLPDDRAAAMQYLDAVVGAKADARVRAAFVEHAAEALAYLEANSELKLDLRQVSPDYHPEIAASSDRGRVLDVRSFDGRRLGRRLADLRPPIETHVLFGGIMVSRQDVQTLLRVHRSPAAVLHAAKLGTRYLYDRFMYKRSTRLVLGSALAARLAATVFDLGIRLELNCPGSELIRTDDGRVAGVVASPRNGAQKHIHARHGVVLATGGFAANAELSSASRAGSTALHLTMIPDCCIGDGISLGEGVGAAVGQPDTNAFFWAPVSVHRKNDGSVRRFAHLTTDRAKPGVIAVERTGARFTNEANSYHRFGDALRTLPGHIQAPSAWLIADAAALRRYGLGIAKPFPAHLPNRKLIRDGYLIKAESIAALAVRLDLPVKTFQETIVRHNADVRTGRDTLFGKGDTSHNRALGDQACGPNPCLAPIERSPFYAVGLYSGDLGTARGLRTDEHARVLDRKSEAVPGLYAVGNDMQSIMGGTYPGPGITLGPALVFGYLAARDLARRAEHTKELKTA